MQNFFIFFKKYYTNYINFMCWYKIGSKNILFSLQKYFIVLLTIFSFSQKIIGEDTSEKDIKAKFEEIKKKKRCSCCINFEDFDMNFAINLSKTNKEMKKKNEEYKKQLEEKNKEISDIKKNLFYIKILKNEDNKNEEQIIKYKEQINKYKEQINKYEEQKNDILIENQNLKDQLKIFSSNVNGVDIVKIQQKVDENRIKEIINIFNDNTLGEPLTDTCIFYLPFQFLVDEKKEIIKSQHKVIKSEANELYIYDYNSNKNNNSNKKSLENNQCGKKKQNLSFTGSKENINKKDVISKNGNSTKYARKLNNLNLNKSSTTGSFFNKTQDEKNEDIKIIDNNFYIKANSSRPAGYTVASIENLNKTIFSRYSVAQRIKQPTMDIDTLKKLYLINKGAEWEREKKEEEKKDKENEDKNKNKEENTYTIKTFDDNGIKKVNFSSQCFYKSKQSIAINLSDVKEMKIPKDIMKKININYKDYINFVDVDEYFKLENKNKFFLLKLDLKDPECIALLQ